MKRLLLALAVALLPFALSAQNYYGFGDGEEIVGEIDLSTDVELFVESGAATFTGPIQGYVGTLYKTGAGTLTINGTNISESPISILAGTLVFGTEEAFGPTFDIYMAADTLLRFSADAAASTHFSVESLNIEVDPSVSVTLAGLVRTASNQRTAVNKSGSGTLTLTNYNSGFTGGAITGGTLEIQGGKHFVTNATVSIAAGATLLYSAYPPDHPGGSTTFTQDALFEGEGSVVVAQAQGSGTITISTTQTYTGGTTITSGTLKLGSSERLADTGALIMNGGTFNSNGYDEILGTLSVTADSFFDFGSGASDLLFADSSALAWSGTLTLLNFTLGSDTLRFGTDETGLTLAQLGLIDFGDGLWAQIDSLGFVTASTEAPSAIPEPGTSAAFAGAFVLAAALFRRRSK